MNPDGELNLYTLSFQIVNSRAFHTPRAYATGTVRSPFSSAYVLN